MRVVHAEGVEGARAARGIAIVIDVLRAFTVSAYALAHGALRCELVGTVEQVRAAGHRLGGRAVLSAEVDGLPVPGIPVSNSPTLLLEQPLRDRVLVQRSTSGVQAALAAGGRAQVVAGALVVAAATAEHVRRLDPDVVTLVASGAPLGHPEDRACGDLIEALLAGRRPPPLDELLAPLRASERYQKLARGQQPGFPPHDLELALRVDAFDFAMTVEPVGEGAVVRRVQGSR
jgi:2-phosphosulfolactate phosphatase